MNTTGSNERPPDISVYPAEWSTWTKRLAVILLLAAGIYSLTFIGPVLQIVVIALLLALLFFTPIQLLTLRFRIPYTLSVVLVFAIYLGLITLVILRLGPVISDTVEAWRNPLEKSTNDIIRFFQNYDPSQGVFVIPQSNTSIDLNFILGPISEVIKGNISGLNQQLGSINFLGIAGTVSSTVQVVLSALGTLLVGHFLAFLILLDFPQIYRSFERTDDVYEREYAILIRRVYRVWAGFFKGQVIIAVIVGVGTWLQLAVMGIPASVFVGVFAGLLSVIPTIGSLIGLIPTALAPLVGGSTVMTNVDHLSLMLLVVGINFVIIQVIFYNMIAPKITGDAVSLPLPVIIIGLFIGTAFGGILGALLVAPLMGTIRIIVDYTLCKIRGGDPYPGEVRPVLSIDKMFERRKRRPASIAELAEKPVCV